MLIWKNDRPSDTTFSSIHNSNSTQISIEKLGHPHLDVLEIGDAPEFRNQAPSAHVYNAKDGKVDFRHPSGPANTLPFSELFQNFKWFNPQDGAVLKPNHYHIRLGSHH